MLFSSSEVYRCLISVKWFVAGLVLLVVAGHVEYGYAFDFSVKRIIANVLHDADGEVRVAPPAIRVGQTQKPTFTRRELIRLRQLLENRQFTALTKAAQEVQEAFEADPSFEYKLTDFFDVFGTADSEHEGLLNEWVNHSSSSFAPYLARAQYFMFNGWAARGTKFANETDRLQFANMTIFMDKCKRDIDSALERNSKLLPAYSMLIEIANAQGDNEEENAIIARSIDLFPSSFLLFYKMLWVKMPRWGGSYSEMNNIAMKAYEQIKVNEELYLLFGRIYAYKASDYRESNKIEEAVALCKKALQYGEHYSFYEELAQIYERNKEFREALENINRAIAIRPNVYHLYRRRAGIYARLDMLEGALDDFAYLDIRVPGDPQTKVWREWTAKLYMNMGHKAGPVNKNQAIVFYDRALRILPCFRDVHHWRGVVNAQMGDYDTAQSDFAQAIECGSRNIDTFKLLDGLLAHQEKWQEVIGYWNVYLAWDSESGDAYLERAGTFKNMGNMESAIADLNRACDLKQQQACNILKRY
jgi:tetratricopeptide (TPR) repeat protein